jgi:serine/threonine-protein kinase
VSTTSSDSWRGRLLDGRYRVESRIARGGMATVYTGVDTRLDRAVAIKIMHAGLGDDDDFAARFVREARAAARLNHPNVVAVFDQGSDDGTVFLVMEYVPGSTLRDLIREQAPLPPQRALAVLERVLAALSAAHEAGLVHRDVKPENVLIAPDGSIKVADFGLARAVSSSTAATATSGLLIGTVSYLAPELVLNQGADARCDVYACGVLLYEMLTGRKPHEGESPIQVAYKHVHEDVRAPSLLAPGTPPYLDALVARATARDRDLRPADAKVLLQQVRRVRGAVESGVADDAELTQDLTPHLATVRLRTAQAEEPLLLPPPPALVPEPTLVVRDTSEREVAVPVGMPTQQPPAGDSGATAWDQTWPRSRRRGWALIALVVALAIAAAASGWYLGVGRFTTMPDVEGTPRPEAQAAIEDAGLSFEVAEARYSEVVPEGAVISTDPEPNARIAKGDAVSVVLSKGKERYAVPPVIDLTLEEAQQQLEKAHLRAQPRQRYNATTDAGVVFYASPSPGTELRPGEGVTIYVSKGPRPIQIPDTSGDPYQQAREELERLGFMVPRPEREFSDEVDKGAVITQTPSEGTGYRGDAIQLTVSKGPELAEVPIVIGYSPGGAQERLETAGFEVRTRHDDSYIGGFLVVGQEPGGGQQAPVGSTITIYVV